MSFIRVLCLPMVLSWGLLITSPVQAASTFSAKLLDWDGKQVPTGQQCQKFGGNQPATPRIQLSGVPDTTNLIMLEYSDRSYQPMNHGGHGRMAFAIHQPSTNLMIPSVPGHRFDLPSGFMIIEPHRNPKWDQAGAYMPPCSGGKGNDYYVTVTALHFNGKQATSLAKTVIELGKY